MPYRDGQIGQEVKSDDARHCVILAVPQRDCLLGQDVKQDGAGKLGQDVKHVGARNSVIPAML